MARGKTVQVRVTDELLVLIDRTCERQKLTRSTLGEAAFERIVADLSTTRPLSPKRRPRR